MRYFNLSIYEDPVEEVFWNEEEFSCVGAEEIDGRGRWSTSFSQVLKYKDGTFWRARWQRGSTEYQDEGVEDLTLVQVEPYQVTETRYKAID